MHIPTNFSMTHKPLLITNHLSKVYTDGRTEPVEVLNDVSIEIYANEIVSVIGPSGCGKSTLLDCIAGLTHPDKGNIYLQNTSIIDRRGKVSYMMQDDVLLPWRTVFKNILIAAELRGKKDSLLDEAQQLMKDFGLYDFSDRYPHELSGGMRQRVSLLRAYVCQKECMLMDEPFGKLDALTRLQVQSWFLEIWKQKKISILLVTHNIDEALFLSDRIYVLSSRPGKVIGHIEIPIKWRRVSQRTVGMREVMKMKKKLLHLLKVE